MYSIWKTGMLCLGLLAGLSSVGCQSGGANTPASHTMAGNAVHCDKCQVTWVKDPIRNGEKSSIVGYTIRKEMECPDCRDAVSTFFATGNLKHECKACSGNMAICESH
jgi:hypothetical protein